MPSLREAIFALYGCWRLLLWDPRGLQRLDPSPEAALRSFSVALFMAPAYLVLVLLRMQPVLGSVSLAELVAVHAPAYVLSWTAYPLLMSWITAKMDCSRRFPLFVTAHNWLSLLLTPVYIPLMVLVEGNLLGPDIADSLSFILTMIILSCWWIVTHLTLGLTPLITTGLVMINLILSEFITALAEVMLLV